LYALVGDRRWGCRFEKKRLIGWLLHSTNDTISMNRGNLSDDWHLLAVLRTCERGHETRDVAVLVVATLQLDAAVAAATDKGMGVTASVHPEGGC